MRVSPTATIYFFEAKLDSTFALGSKTFLPTLKPNLTTSAPRLDTGARYSLPGQEFHLTNYCAPNRRPILSVLYQSFHLM